jgi:hypothetical protein
MGAVRAPEALAAAIDDGQVSRAREAALFSLA